MTHSLHPVRTPWDVPLESEPERIARLEKRIAKLEKINAVLIDRVERGLDSHASAFSLFQTAIGLERQVRERTDELTRTLHKLERTNEELSRAKEVAERADRSKTRFLAQAGHDLMQPLTAARLSLSALEDLQREEDGRRLVRKIERGLGSIDDLLRTLLDISRLDSGVLVPRIEILDLDDLLADLATSFASVAARRGLRFDVLPCRLHVATDPAMLGRILQNLIGNALRYTEHGRVLVGVRRLGDDRLRIDVVDTGPGIAEDQHRAVFEEFHRGRTAAPDGEVGLGLGLSIVQRLADVLDHRVTLRSRLGHGSIFSVELPRVDAPDETAPIEAPHPVDVPQGWGLAEALVVVIDDDPAARDATVDLIGRWSCAAVAATSSAEARSRLAEIGRRPDLLLVEDRLAGETGVDAVAALRADWGAGLPAMLVTAAHGRAAEKRLAASGLEVLRKPVRPAELRALMAHLLG